jgi:threonine aldolase
MIDLRSDTITQPTPAMRQAMANAPVGDDVFGDDPTVQALEKRVAQLLGKEAAVFVPSGTMSNQIALRAHTEPGDEIVLEAESHIYYYEAGGPAALSGVSCRLISGERGIFTASDVKAVLRTPDQHFPTTKLICIENTHNRGGGSIWPIENIAEIAALARDLGLKMHMDGARLWNASVATGVAEQAYARHFDSVSVCFSKGLGAPVGSALVGTDRFIARARRFRKQFGGGMRQVGIIAAGALYALEHHRQRLSEDHEHARILAAGIASLPGIELDPATVQTNMVVFRVTAMPASLFCQKAKDAGVDMLARTEHTVRAVTHLNVNREQIRQAVDCIAHLLGHHP